MRAGTFASIIFAIALIGSATWSRVARSEAQGTLVLTATTQDSEQNPADLYPSASAGSEATGTPEKLTDTDLVARQLFSDYLSLSANGQATQNNLDSLAEQYASNITSLNKAPRARESDLQIIASSKTSLSSYAAALSAISTKYKKLLLSASESRPIGDTMDANAIYVMKSLGNIYAQEASELKAVAVPEILAADHTDLINYYLSQAWALKTISDPKSDSAVNFAAMASAGQNGADADILKKISSTLSENGV